MIERLFTVLGFLVYVTAGVFFLICVTMYFVEWIDPETRTVEEKSLIGITGGLFMCVLIMIPLGLVVTWIVNGSI